MFNGASSFNRNISSWDTSKVTNMASMFLGATAFNQNVASLNIALVTNMDKIFYLSGMSQANYHNLLIGWGTGSKSSQSNITFVIDSEFDNTNSSAVAGRNYLINTKNWKMVDWGDQDTEILTFNCAFSNGYTNNYLYLAECLKNLSSTTLEINWGDGSGSNNAATALDGHTYNTAGNFDVRIRVRTGTFFTFQSHPYMRYYLINIKRCGTKFKLADGGAHFIDSRLTTVSASDFPVLPDDNNLSNCFRNSTLYLWPALSSIDTSSITSMREMFFNTNFAGPVYGWDFSNVTDMYFFMVTTNAYPTQFYNNLLRNLADNTTKNNVQLRVNAYYSNTSSVISAKNTVLSRGWSISDYGATT
jgi:surface protein